MSRKEDQNPLMQGRKRPHWGRTAVIVLCVLTAFVIAGGIAIRQYVHSLFRSTNYVENGDVVELETLPDEAVEGVTEAEDGTGENSLGESELEALKEKMNIASSSFDAVMNTNVYNILLCGVDRSDKSWSGNSDSMMLISLNNEQDRISVISLMRDTYVAIPGHDYNKLNSAYAYGGGPLLLRTVQDNFRIDVMRYAAVDFQDMVTIIDAMGGIEMTWTDQEVEVANGYMIDMCQNVLNIPFEEHLLPEGGTYLSDGVQAVAYARNRFVGNSDYSRTQRQRYVISRMVEKLKSMGPTELLTFASKVLPLITHNIPEPEIWDLIEDAPSLLKYDYVQDRAPYDNLYEIVEIGGQGMLVPDWDDTISQMRETIYGDGSVSNNTLESEAGTEFTDEYMTLTGGTGTLFQDGFPIGEDTEQQPEDGKKN